MEETNKIKNRGGLKGFFIRIFYAMVAFWLRTKWTLRRAFTRHKKFNWATAQNHQGQNAVLTGTIREGSVGFELAKHLLRAGMDITVGCRNIEESEVGFTRIRDTTDIRTGTIVILRLNLASIVSVKKFAEKVERGNRANIKTCPFELTGDGFESQFHVNFLSNFLLTNQLGVSLARAGTNEKKARVVNVCSIYHFGGGRIDLHDLKREAIYSPYRAQMRSMLLQLIMSMELHERVEHSRENIRSNSVDPGFVWPDFGKDSCVDGMFRCLFKPFYNTVAQAADEIAYAALSNDLEDDGGLFLVSCKKIRPNPTVFDKNLHLRLRTTARGFAGLLHRDDVRTMTIRTQRLCLRDIKIPAKNFLGAVEVV